MEVLHVPLGHVVGLGITSTASWTPLIGSLHSVQGVCDVHTVTCAAHEMTHNFGPYCYDPANPWSTDCNDADDEAWGLT